jgi:hypothetical protein
MVAFCIAVLEFSCYGAWRGLIVMVAICRELAAVEKGVWK